jgi:hypothetical protein
MVSGTVLSLQQIFQTAFHETLFALLKEILTKIEQAVANDKTIMIVAVHLHPTAKVDQTFCTYIKKLIVVAAVSYQTRQLPQQSTSREPRNRNLQR